MATNPQPSISAARSVKLSPLGLVLLLCLGCSPTPDSEVTTTPDYVLSFSNLEFMNLVLDPAADIIWGSAGFIITEAGEEDLAPTTTEGWLAVQQSAATIMESANLLMLPGRALDNQDWAEYSRGLATMGRKAYAAAEAQDADALFNAGADLYQVCLACHQKYDRD